MKNLPTLTRRFRSAFLLAGWSCAAMFAAAWSLTGTTMAQSAGQGVTVLVAADALDQREGLRPKSGQPIYYLLKTGQASFGEVMAGTKLPDPPSVERLVERELRKQGYVRATIGEGPPPSILIQATWGEANFAPATEEEIIFNMPLVLERQRATAAGVVVTDNNERLQEAGWNTYLQSPRAKDQVAMYTIVGANKGKAEDVKNRRVLYAAYGNRFYLTLTVFDAEAFARKEKRMLWRTSMSIEGGNDFDRALGTMLASGGPVFGINIGESVFMDDRDRRNGEITIGEIAVVSEVPNAPSSSRKDK